MSDTQNILLPGTSYSTKDQVIKTIDSAGDSAVFFLHLDFVMYDRSSNGQRVRTFLEVTRDQAKVFIDTTDQMRGPRDYVDLIRVRITQRADPKAAYNAIWIG